MCKFERCERKALTRGYCQKHYLRLTRSGELAVTPQQLYAGMICYIPVCDKPAHTRFLCSAHYQRLMRNEAMLAPVKRRPDGECEVEGCDRWQNSLGLCKTHYAYYQTKGIKVEDMKPIKPLKSRTLCRIPDCDKMSKARQLCEKHYSRFKRGTLVETGERLADVEMRNRIEDTEELLDFGVTDREEIMQRAGWGSLKHMRNNLPPELYERILALSKDASDDVARY